MNQWVVVTGCSSGIGYASLAPLKQAGYRVIATCRKPQDVERIKSEGYTCLLLDLDSQESISHCAEAIATLTEGELYALFNNAAYGQPGALEDLPVAALKAQFNTNLFGWHDLTQRLLPLMHNCGQARIVQNSSVLGFAAMKYRGAYNASKFALEGYTDTLRLELSDTNVRVSLIEPGPIETRFRANALAAFLCWITPDNSRHAQQYEKQIQRLEKEQSGSTFALPASACIPPLLHALKSERPKARYRVTTPTKVFAVFKRLLPTSILDKVLSKAA
ncbi:SDR family oxidoreductase [Vibrio astriarenae]|uniref:SDR family oxidoreductase n=1 Tax=Vibrio astriarenae TaxID=1481923 RepID=A0A7Z2T1V8_9VIBR|nr:SDR family oxidoreductase [Vibrio astriarenae]QIA62741.1 SDR family oxidoreductase [Vibrio astriarenae]